MDLTFDDGPDASGTDGADGIDPGVIDDVAYLARSVHRVEALAALAERPRTRDELRTMTGVSASTISRTLNAFERRNWIRRDGHHYAATDLGAYVADGMGHLVDRVATERSLRDVWQWLPTGASGLSIDHLSDAVVTVAEATDPYRPINRFVTLLADTDRFRFVGFDLALLEPCKDEVRRRILDGMRTEIIDPPDVARYMLSTHPDHCADPLESGNLTVRVHDDVPTFGLSIFDDRVAIVGYDTTSGTVHVLVDTDDPAAREWATTTFERYRREARPLPITVTAE